MPKASTEYFLFTLTSIFVISLHTCLLSVVHRIGTSIYVNRAIMCESSSSNTELLLQSAIGNQILYVTNGLGTRSTQERPKVVLGDLRRSMLAWKPRSAPDSPRACDILNLICRLISA